jgi:putative membrane protein
MMWNGACPFFNTAGMGAWGWVGMGLHLLFWAAVAAGVVFLVVWLARRTAVPGSAQVTTAGDISAQEIAQRRYAQGEISREEYLRLKDDLR